MKLSEEIDRDLLDDAAKRYLGVTPHSYTLTHRERVIIGTIERRIAAQNRAAARSALDQLHRHHPQDPE